MRNKNRDISIEANFHNESVGRPDGGVNVYEHGVYPSGSVLEGQDSRTFLDYFDTVEEAKAEYPGAYESGSSYQAPYLPDYPASWFDRDNAGEEW